MQKDVKEARRRVAAKSLQKDDVAEAIPSPAIVIGLRIVAICSLLAGLIMSGTTESLAWAVAGAITTALFLAFAAIIDQLAVIAYRLKPKD